MPDRQRMFLAGILFASIVAVGLGAAASAQSKPVLGIYGGDIEINEKSANETHNIVFNVSGYPNIALDQETYAARFYDTVDGNQIVRFTSKRNGTTLFSRIGGMDGDIHIIDAGNKNNSHNIRFEQAYYDDMVLDMLDGDVRFFNPKSGESSLKIRNNGQVLIPNGAVFLKGGNMFVKESVSDDSYDITFEQSGYADMGMHALNGYVAIFNASDTNSQEIIRFKQFGGSGNGEVVVPGTFTVQGSKNFRHQLNATHNAIYTSQESPQVRAVIEDTATVTDSEANISLPYHFSEVVSDTRPDMTVQATPHQLTTVAVTERTDDYIVVKTGIATSVKVDYRVTGIRDGYEDKDIVRRRR